MPVTPSPLRYPGGKTSLLDLTVQVLKDNKLERCTYAEPFAGGGGLALSLLFEGHVRRIILNDLDPAIWSFWHSILNDTDEFVDLLSATPVTMDEWHRQREIHKSGNAANSLELGFSTFFLNRTNRSGVIKGGVIGGKEQKGNYGLDCRFPTDALIHKIRRISRYKESIELFNLDGEEFLNKVDGTRTKLLFFIDPPYFHKGAGLYTNFYTPADHASLASTITALEDRWVLTYDLTPEIQSLYADFDQYEFGINYSVSTKRVGTELFVPSSRIKISSSPTPTKTLLRPTIYEEPRQAAV